MTTDLAQKLQELKQLLDNGLLTPAEYERERETLLAAWRAPSAPSVSTVSVDLDALPTVIALPLQEYLGETHPVLKLWYACDSVEMLLRLVVMMGLAVLSQRGPLTPKLRKRLQEYRLEEPTLGNWRALADAVVEALGNAPGPLPELPGLVRGLRSRPCCLALARVNATKATALSACATGWRTAAASAAPWRNAWGRFGNRACRRCGNNWLG